MHVPNGRWNLEALLERTAHTPLAPTGKAKLEPRPGFPYIAATGARINFKNGQEKKPYALTNAEFSLWQDSENAWGVRLKAQPFRTDLNLNDTGILEVDGTWQRAATLRETPLQLNIEWNRASLANSQNFLPEATRDGEVMCCSTSPCRVLRGICRLRAMPRSRIFAAMISRPVRPCGWLAIATGSSVRPISNFANWFAPLRWEAA